MRWWYFDDSTCRTIVFRPKTVNSVSRSHDYRHGRGLTFRLMNRAQVGQDSAGEPTDLITICYNSKPSWPNSKPIPVSKS